MKFKIGDYHEDGKTRDVKCKFTKDDLISLDTTLAIVIHAALVAFNKKGTDRDVDYMIWTFGEIANGNHICNFDKEYNNNINKGLKQFAKRFTGLWY